MCSLFQKSNQVFFPTTFVKPKIGCCLDVGISNSLHILYFFACWPLYQRLVASDLIPSMSYYLPSILLQDCCTALHPMPLWLHSCILFKHPGFPTDCAYSGLLPLSEAILDSVQFLACEYRTLSSVIHHYTVEKVNAHRGARKLFLLNIEFILPCRFYILDSTDPFPMDLFIFKTCF